MVPYRGAALLTQWTRNNNHAPGRNRTADLCSVGMRSIQLSYGRLRYKPMVINGQMFVAVLSNYCIPGISSLPWAVQDSNL